MDLLKPQHLNLGDTIGLVAPSFPFPIKKDAEGYYNQYLNGKREIEKIGFKIKEGKNLRKVHWWAGGTPKERAEDINAMYADPEVRAIIAHDGGHAVIDLLELLDYKLIKNNPKPFMGFSDITNIHIASFIKTGLVGFQMGLLSYTLGWNWKEFIIEESQKQRARKLYFNILTSTQPLGTIQPFSKWECWRKGKIFFWETNNTESYRIQRGLYQLKYAGILDVITGMVIGKLPDIKPSGWQRLYEPTPKEIVMDIVKNYDFPVLAEVDFGHKNINLPMPIGIEAEIDAEKLSLVFKEAVVV